MGPILLAMLLTWTKLDYRTVYIQSPSRAKCLPSLMRLPDIGLIDMIHQQWEKCICKRVAGQGEWDATADYRNWRQSQDSFIEQAINTVRSQQRRVMFEQLRDFSWVRGQPEAE
jgi:hypothetical protein